MFRSAIRSGRFLTVSLIAMAAMMASTQMALSQPWDWVLETVDSGADVGEHTSLVLDGSGWPRISYYEGHPNYNLKYAYRDASGWHTEIVDAVDAGEYTSLALNAFGKPRISYYHWGSAYDLKYAYRDASGWHTETVDAAGVVGKYTSLALSDLGRPRISYFDDTNDDLKYAYRDASGWHTETVDAAGYGTSLDLDGSGYPHISYALSQPYYDLKYAYRDGTGWHIETVDGPSPVGGETSLALDGSGYPHISYQGGDLKYAYRNASGWHAETVDAELHTGYDSSLVLDAAGWPHISYRDLSSNDVHYAYRDASGWYTEIVDSVGNVGRMSSLALDASSRPRISYHDDTNGELKYAYAVSPILLTGSLSNGELVLDWTTVADATSYWVYAANNQTYFIPGFTSPYPYRIGVFPPGTTTWSSTNGVGNPDTNRTYLVLAVDPAERILGISNRVGEHDFQAGAP